MGCPKRRQVKSPELGPQLLRQHLILSETQSQMAPEKEQIIDLLIDLTVNGASF